MKILKLAAALAFALGILIVFGAVGSMDAGTLSGGACMLRAGGGIILLIAAAVLGEKITESEE